VKAYELQITEINRKKNEIREWLSEAGYQGGPSASPVKGGNDAY
jgi:hypothetical protein